MVQACGHMWYTIFGGMLMHIYTKKGGDDMDEDKVLKVRLSAKEWQAVYTAKGDLSVSNFVRAAIQKFTESEKKETGEFVKLIQTIHANVDFLMVRIRQLEAIENVLLEILKILENMNAQGQTGMKDEDKRHIAKLIYVVAQAGQQAGWNALNQAAGANKDYAQARQWMLDLLKERG